MKNLKRQIEEYIPFNIQEEQDKNFVLKFIKSFDDFLLRDNIFAHFSSSAFVLNEDGTKFLVIHHNIYNGWMFPGGHADGEEDLLSVAIKEIEEETGVKAKPITKEIFSIEALPTKGHMKRGKYVSAHIHINVMYLLKANEKEVLKVKEDENSGVKWINFSDLYSEDIVDFCKPIINKCIDKYNLLIDSKLNS